MNSKMPANLDPKLKETYERVMGTSFAPAASPPAPVQQHPVQTTVVQEPEAPVATVPVMPASLPPIDVANSAPEMVQSPQMPKTGDPFKEAVSPPTTVIMQGVTPKKKNFLMPVLLGIGGLIFFVAYAVIWAKVFGMF
jgi:hypothetical protein